MSTGNPKNHAALRYTAMRLGIFAACFLVLWLLALLKVVEVDGDKGVVLMLGIAVLVSAPISYVVLNKQRDAMSEAIVDKVTDTKRRLADSRTMEDEEDAGEGGNAPLRTRES